VDLAELTADLNRVVTETVQPTSASLWLRDPDVPGEHRRR
jgi:hypothetical protein